jgi:hypothetical protein
MTKYVELPHNKKLNLLREHSMGCDWPDLDQKHWCLHCRKKFNGHSVRVWKSEDNRLWLECGTPGCDGSPIDWAPYPWWDPDNPEAKAPPKRAKGQAKTRRKPKRSPPGDEADDVPF